MDAHSLGGVVYAAGHPISGTAVHIYSVSPTAAPTEANQELSSQVTTDAAGHFLFGSLKTCPGSNSLVYLVAHGGSTGYLQANSNASLALMTTLGTCDDLAGNRSVTLDELSTVASAYPLAPFVDRLLQVHAAGDPVAFAAAIQASQDLLSEVNGTTAPQSAQDLESVQKINTLAAILASCTTSASGLSGASSACGQLLAVASPGDTSQTDTLGAMIQIALNPTRNVEALFSLVTPQSFAPLLSKSPSDWIIAIPALIAGPGINPGTGTYKSSQTVSLSPTISNAIVYYTTDGSLPTAKSPIYSGPFTVAQSTLIQAIAVSAGRQSILSSALLTIPAQVSVALAPSTVTLYPQGSQQLQSKISGSANHSVIWSLRPSLGTISATGLYTAPATVAQATTVAVSAQSSADPTQVATSIMMLLPPISVSVAPSRISLKPSASTQFFAIVLNTSNTGVTWTIDSAQGRLTSQGLYTAPATVSSTQLVTVTAQSKADPTRSGSVGVWLVPSTTSIPTLYVDCTLGNDANDGLSPLTPFATLAHISSLPLRPGQIVALRAGEVWHETLAVTQSGTRADPIVFTSYGSGAQPVITAADFQGGWKQVLNTPSVWYRTQATNPYLVNFAGQVGTKVASSTLVTAERTFSWDDAKLTVYSPGNPQSVVEVPQRSWPVNLSGANFVTLDNIEVRGAQSSNIYCNASTGCAGLTMTRVTSRAAYTNGFIAISPDTGPAGDITILKSTFSGLGGAALSLDGSMATGATIGSFGSGNTISDVCLQYTSQPTTIGSYLSFDNTYCDAIKTYTNSNTGGNGTEIAYNTIQNVGIGQPNSYGGGIHFDTTLGGRIEHNLVRNTNGPGIQLEKTQGGSLAQYNLVIYGGLAQYAAGLMIRAGDGVNTSGATMQYNTAYGGWWACDFLVQQNAGTATATGTTFQKNICNSASSNTDFYADSGAVGSGNVINTSSFGVAVPYFLVVGGKILKSYAEFDALMGYSTNSVVGDPMFTNPANGNFTLKPSSPAMGIGAYPGP